MILLDDKWRDFGTKKASLIRSHLQVHVVGTIHITYVDKVFEIPSSLFYSFKSFCAAQVAVLKPLNQIHITRSLLVTGNSTK